jgi:hypothetical protein
MPSSGSSSPGTVSGTVRNVVLVHGAYADGSSWSEVIERVQGAGLAATAVQNPLTSLADDVAHTRRVLALQDGKKNAVPLIFSRSRCVTGRWRRWHAASGTIPRPLPAAHIPVCPGRDRGQLRHAPRLRGASPCRPAPRRRPSGAPGTH